MPIFKKLPPLSLYIHLPWCVQKCPYCDFNSHAIRGSLPEEIYIKALLQELDSVIYLTNNRSLMSIFFGGGTPSLFSAKGIETILNGVLSRIPWESDIEITLEANPGASETARFRDFRAAGVNRLSIGIQSLQDEKLQALGRIHDHKQALKAIEAVKDAGFTNFNLDIMYGLPNQTLEDALFDMETALSFTPTHFSWYQLTLEPNTLFYHQKPILPTDELIWDIQMAGLDFLNKTGFKQYEVSAYSLPGRNCMHNRNYWEFGDYLGIGAGAHSKITTSQEIIRFAQVKHPKDYLDPCKRRLDIKPISSNDLAFEFMLNALRLTEGFDITLFTERTGLPIQVIQLILDKAKNKGLLEIEKRISPTGLGKRFLNDLTELFLDFT